MAPLNSKAWIKLKEFFQEKGTNFYPRGTDFKKRTLWQNPIINVGVRPFLDEQQRFKKFLLPFVKEVINENELKIYFVMVSWWGRKDRAFRTGGYLLNDLINRFQKQGLGKVFLSYQKGTKEVFSKLYKWCERKGVPVLDVDDCQLSYGRKVIIPKAAPGKAENVIKAIKLIEQKCEKKKLSPQKILIIFIDDDYTQYHWLNYFLLFAPWVLSFSKDKTKDKNIDALIDKLSKLGLIKSGSPRIILPYECQDLVVHGGLDPMDYLELTLFVLDSALVRRAQADLSDTEDIDNLISILKETKQTEQIYSPHNRNYYLKNLDEKLERIWRQYIFEGGRVTQQLGTIFYYNAHKLIFRWLKRFTYLLHGDQGASLEFWRKVPLIFSGYGIEISLLYQALFDKSLQKYQILNVEGLPHSHQRSKDLDIRQMTDVILFCLDVLRLIYGDIAIKEVLAKYGPARTFNIPTRFGDVIKHQPKIRGLNIYPSLKKLRIS